MSDVTTDTMMHSVTAGIAVDIAEEGFDRVSAILSGIQAATGPFYRFLQ